MADLSYSEAKRIIGTHILAWLTQLQEEDETKRLDQIDRGDVFLLTSDIMLDLLGATIVSDPGLPPGVLVQQHGKLSEWPEPSPRKGA